MFWHARCRAVISKLFTVPTNQDELSHWDALGETIWHHGILWCQVAKNYRNCNSSARWGQLSGRYHNILSLWKFWLQSREATTCLTSGSNSGSQMCGSSCRGLARKSAGQGDSGNLGGCDASLWPCTSETLGTFHFQWSDFPSEYKWEKELYF